MNIMNIRMNIMNIIYIIIIYIYKKGSTPYNQPRGAHWTLNNALRHATQRPAMTRDPLPAWHRLSHLLDCKELPIMCPNSWDWRVTFGSKSLFFISTWLSQATSLAYFLLPMASNLAIYIRVMISGWSLGAPQNVTAETARLRDTQIGVLRLGVEV